jgi:hypothetical protein
MLDLDSACRGWTVLVAELLGRDPRGHLGAVGEVQAGEDVLEVAVGGALRAAG